MQFLVCVYIYCEAELSLSGSHQPRRPIDHHAACTTSCFHSNLHGASRARCAPPVNARSWQTVALIVFRSQNVNFPAMSRSAWFRPTTGKLAEKKHTHTCAPSWYNPVEVGFTATEDAPQKLIRLKWNATFSTYRCRNTVCRRWEGVILHCRC